MDEETYQFIMDHCVIRPNKALDALARAETPWTIDIGIFKSYINDNSPKLEQKCFEFDWENMKVLKYKKSDPEDIKEEMRQIYPMMRETYKV